MLARAASDAQRTYGLICESTPAPLGIKIRADANKSNIDLRISFLRGFLREPARPAKHLFRRLNMKILGKASTLTKQTVIDPQGLDNPGDGFKYRLF